jgi:hypothetical protein
LIEGGLGRKREAREPLRGFKEVNGEASRIQYQEKTVENEECA